MFKVERPVREGDWVYWRGREWYVEEVDGPCAWVMDKSGHEEWVPVRDLDKVVGS